MAETEEEKASSDEVLLSKPSWLSMTRDLRLTSADKILIVALTCMVVTALSLATIASIMNMAPIKENGCTNRQSCSMNGDCDRGWCLCDAGWNGTFCHQLKFGAHSQNTGLRIWDRTTQLNTSTWGGAVVQGNGQYHMYTSVLSRNCGQGSYRTNSYVAHASSTSPLGPYHLQGVVVPQFSHEPAAVRGPVGEYVVYFTGTYRGKDDNWTRPAWGSDGSDAPQAELDCSDGHAHGFTCDTDLQRCVNSTTPTHTTLMECGASCGQAPLQWPHRDRPDCDRWSCWGDPTYMTWSMQPDGPWSTPKIVMDPLPNTDTNMVGLIGSDGAFVGIANWQEVRDGAGLPVNRSTGRSVLRAVTASDWKDPSTYMVQPSVNLLEGQEGGAGLRDPSSIWKDRYGGYHVLLEAGTHHAYSPDGMAWTLTEKMQMEPQDDCPTPARPQLVFAADEATPVALATACTWTPKVFGKSFTSVVPIAP